MDQSFLYGSLCGICGGKGAGGRHSAQTGSDPAKTKDLRWSYEKSTLGEAENKEKGSTESKTNHTVLLAKPYSYLPATSGRGERVSNGLPGQTVKGRGCNTEEGGCFGNAEAPDDDHCNPAHVWNFSFLVCP